MTPRATYRLQFHRGFTFADALGVIDYLDRLGVSHVYASPVTTARRGSLHGYDVTDPTRVNPELGGEEALKRLAAALRERGMGLIIDIVPNHMGVAGGENPWWQDVLAHGQASSRASWFDIDWRAPLLLPVLGAPLPDVIGEGQLRLAETGQGLQFRLYGETDYPIRPDDPVQAMPDALVRHDSADARGRAALEALALRQHYRLAYWRTSNDEINWRRFFSINDLAGLRIEEAAVFDAVHALPFRLFAEGIIDGVRVDHVDGLSDPAGYCRTLRAGLREAGGREPWVVVEKILAPGEQLPSDWEVEGTTGYDFMREVAALLHDPAGAAPLRQLWAAISGRPAYFAEEERVARRQLLAWQFDAQLRSCVEAFADLAAGDPAFAWIPPAMLRRAIERLIWVFPVYRTYGTGSSAPPQDDPVRQAALEAAAPFTPPGEAALTGYVADWLAGNGPGAPALAADAVRRFQQLSAPIAAKAVEDTAFYRHGALLSANEVGSDPASLSMSLADFHAAMAQRARRQPRAMLALATHDHKRGPDARARLAVLAGLPERWGEQARAWLAMAEPAAAGVDPGDAYMLLQTLVGAWEESAAADPPAFLARIRAWQEKALREAKLRSSWADPDLAYEARCNGLAEALLTHPEQAAFRTEFTKFIAAMAPAAAANSLAQTAFHLTVPGVPDIYQGSDLPDYSLVDPDNRRPVDYRRRDDLLSSGRAGGEGPAKLRLIGDLLALRRQHPGLFAEGDYHPLAVHGERAGHVIAFVRSAGPIRLLCAVAVRLGEVLFDSGRPCPPASWWGDTAIAIGTGETLRAADVFAARVVHVEVEAVG